MINSRRVGQQTQLLRSLRDTNGCKNARVGILPGRGLEGECASDDPRARATLAISGALCTKTRFLCSFFNILHRYFSLVDQLSLTSSGMSFNDIPKNRFGNETVGNKFIFRMLFAYIGINRVYFFQTYQRYGVCAGLLVTAN